MSIKFPMYLFPPFFLLTQFIVHILIRMLLPVEPTCMFLSTTWDNKFYTSTKKQTSSLFGGRLKNYEETGWNMRRMLVGQCICKLQNPPLHKIQLFRIEFPLNLRPECNLLGWKPHLLMFQKLICWLNEYNFFHFRLFLWKLCRVFDNVQIYGIARQFRDVNMVGRMRFEYRICKAVIRTQTFITVNS